MSAEGRQASTAAVTVPWKWSAPMASTRPTKSVSPKARGCHGDVDLDVPLAQAVDHLPQRRLRTRVDGTDEQAVEDHVSHGLGAPSTAAQSRRLKKWAFAKNNRSWMR